MDLDAKTTTALTNLLATANSEKRKKNRMTLDDVVRVIEDALASPHGIATRHGGTHAVGLYDKTTICLGVVPPKKPGSVVVGLSYCNAEGASPGRRWKDLQPWMKDVSKNVAKAHTWAAAKSSDRMLVTPSGTTAGKAKAKPAGDGAALLAEVLAHPEDDAARLVYADHLIAGGDPRGELITVQLRLEQTPKKKIAERRNLTKLEEDLLRKHKRAWEKEASQVAEHWELRRGFVWKIYATAQAFASGGAALLAREPVEELAVEKPSVKSVAALANAPHLARLRTLDLGWEPLYISSARDVTALNELLRSKYFGVIPHVSFHLDSPYGRAVPELGELFHGATWPGIRELSIFGPKSQQANFIASLATVKAPALEKLWTPAKPDQHKLLAKAFPKANINPKAK